MARKKQNGGAKAEKVSNGQAEPFPIVALGSSAGGLEAIEGFMKNVRPDSGMAYVIISHLDPHHPSLLAEIVSKSSSINVVQAEDGMYVEKDHVYVLPPGKELIISDNILRTFPRPTDHEPSMPIDYFLRSLADDRRENGVAVILSGNGSDGSFGIRALHSSLGMVMVQSPETAKYDSMPRNAIKTGIVDYVLPPQEMPPMIFRYIDALRSKNLIPLRQERDDDLQKILSIIKGETGHDFSQYKMSTINRRIERRLAVHSIPTKAQYANYLIVNPSEIYTLFKELIIEVTSFFRNPESFDVLKEQLLRNVFERKEEGDSIRVWVVGCSTGEEVYSIGIVLRELLEETKRDLHIQIFGSDIDADSVAQARLGEYSLEIADLITPRRLEKYFVKQENGYKVRKTIRDMVIFAPHNVVRDPPFHHLDIISCRNLLIYFETALQKKVLGTFASALNPGGILFLGESESIGNYESMYLTLDNRWKIFQRRPYLQMPQVEEMDFIPSQGARGTSPDVIQLTSKTIIQDMVDRVFLENHTPPAIILDGNDEIIYFHGRTSKYIEIPPGRASFNLQEMLREDIRYAVLSSIREVRKKSSKVVREAVTLHTNGDVLFLNIEVQPLNERKPVEEVVVIFKEVTIPQSILKGNKKLQINPDKEKRIVELEKELNYTKEDLHNAIEKLETSNEELTSTNEELRSNNEELQSIAEESETAKEELRSLNEELITVNSELERKNQELSMTNSDMRNLMNSMDMATIFLDNNLRIRRFTSKIQSLMNLLPGDIGRPIKDISMNLTYDDLIPDLMDVLERLNTKEREVQTKEEYWYKLKIMPYRTVENVIDGLVITFNDIDAQKKAQEMLVKLTEDAKSAQGLWVSVVDNIKDFILVLNKDLIVLSANASFYKEFNSQPNEILDHPLAEINDRMWNVPWFITALQELSINDKGLENALLEVQHPKDQRKKVRITARILQTLEEDPSTILLFIEKTS